MLFRQSKKEITMKKKVFSIVLTLAMLVSMFSFFTVPAGATPEVVYVSPGDSINFPAYTYYYEVILTGFTRGQTYDIPLNIPKDGHVLVQSFGHSGAYAPAMTLLNGEEIIRQDSPANRGFKTKGYNGNQTLFQFHGSGGYTLRIKPSTSEDMRLSFTLADYYFDETAPIVTFDDITDITETGLQYYWTPGSLAVVGRLTFQSNGSYLMRTTGCDCMRVFVIDPGSTTEYDRYEFIGEVEDYYYFEAGTYYVVMFIPDGNTPHDPILLTFG